MINSNFDQPNIDIDQEYDIDALVGTTDWAQEEKALAHSEISIDEFIDQMISGKESPSSQHLAVLSDLSRQECSTLRENWPLIPVENRRYIIQQLTDEVQENLDLHLGAFLKIAIEDADSYIRKLAIDGLEDTQSDLVGPLIQHLRHDDDLDVRISAASALGAYVLAGELDEFDSTQAMRIEELLLEIMQDAIEPVEIRGAALENIAYSGEVGIRQLIEEAYYSPDEELRLSSLIAMGRSADVRWRGLVRAELSNPSDEIRAAAAQACGELEAKSAMRELLDLLADEELSVRLSSIFALGRIGGKEARRAFEQLSQSEDPEEAEAAALALEEATFYERSDSIPLFDETEAEFEELDADPWGGWYDMDERDLGSYE